MITKLILLAVITVFIVDLSGFSYTLKSLLSYLLTKGKLTTTNYSLKPFTCSLCLTFWLGIVYLLLNASFTIPYICLVCLLAYGTEGIRILLQLMKDLLAKLVSWLYKKLDL
jgi:hypothetical protein